MNSINPIKRHRGANNKIASTVNFQKMGFFESIDRVFAVGWKFGLAYGGLWLFSYCFFIIKFLPTGLGSSDLLFIFFIALGCGILIASISLMGLAIFEPIFSINPHKKKGIIFYLSIIIISTSLILLCFEVFSYLNKETYKIAADWLKFISKHIDEGMDLIYTFLFLCGGYLLLTINMRKEENKIENKFIYPIYGACSLVIIGSIIYKTRSY